ncbi:segregation/condensation protein A [Mycoplasma nasistruthionis]|uniref:Segregation and condensation protein A n=1 Tax=Mycoplasma nasistruthionis TaxID=353852 RepID=A0A4Y6I6M9_9MOLU|nr:segregation/condensation protein A [Mycoplasma nasistruthionis]QCZ36665.1 segregation/condensation protein A [Mycoplasma nasistruthionis]QDF64960.1 segregation/condensation protein A [Mycoplasma nasistruthionis]
MKIRSNPNYAEFTFQFDEFEGPLDLLLNLVREKKMNIESINLVELANQYLEIIDSLKQDDIDVAGEYLVMAATLIKIKANAAIREDGQEPDPEVQIEEDELRRSLLAYEQFKQISKALETFQTERQDIYIKEPSDIEEFIVDVNDSRLDGHSTPAKLINVLKKMFERVHAQKLKSVKLQQINLAPKDQFPLIKSLLKQHPEVPFEMIFNQPSMQHFVITLLALLILANQQFLKIIQTEEYGEIKIVRGELYNEE